MTRIPDHLSGLDWYAPHLAWMQSEGLPVAHDPGDAAPKRADLSGADLRGADLRGVDLRQAALGGDGFDLTGAKRLPTDLAIPSRIPTADLMETT